MRHILSVRCERLIENRSYQQLILFSNQKVLNVGNLAEKLNRELSNRSFTDEIVLVVPAIDLDQTRLQFENEPTLQLYTERLAKHSTITLAGFSSSGQEKKRLHIAGPRTSVSFKIHDLSRQVITKIFQKHGGFVESTGSYHFANPSGRHSKKFIRLGNILVEEEEIGFIAFACLPFIKNNTSHLYIDTPALHTVASSINEIRSIFELPTIGVRNFKSYYGLQTLEVEFDDSDTFLISASSSGGLGKKLRKKFQVFENNIFHLLYLGKSKDVSNIVCDLRYSKNYNPEGYKNLPEVYSKNSCDFCQQGSVPVPLHGDQFDVINTQPDPILISKNDAPTGLEKTLNTFLGSKSLQIDTIKDTKKRKRDFQIDIEKVSNKENFQNKLSYILKRIVPSNSAIIITVDNKSQIVSNTVFRFIKDNGGTAKVIDTKNLSEFDGFSGRTVVVVADVIESGRCLTNVSQALRNNASECPILYLIGVEKTSATKERTALRNTLVQCPHPVQHEYVVLEKLVLPVSTGHNSWIDELRFLRSNKQKFVNSDFERVEARIKVLSESSIPLQDNLFLNSEQNEKLEIQEGFVFWPKNFDKNQTTQADVYYTIASVLQNLRVTARLKSFWHYQTVIHPKNFERYNDGVIRASLLRASSYGELDYSQYKSESHEITQLILGVLRESKSSAGMDAPEFLLAMGTSKLRLREDDSKKIVDAASKSGGFVEALSKCISISD